MWFKFKYLEINSKIFSEKYEKIHGLGGTASIAMEEEASTNNNKLQCVFCKEYFENQPENLHLALWHYEKTEITNKFNNEEEVLDESVNNYPEQNDLAKKNR